MSTLKGKREKRGIKELENVFDENIRFNFYQQVLVLVKTEMQIQL